MDDNSILVNSQFATLNAKIDALVSSLDDSQKEKFKDDMTTNLAKIYENFSKTMSSQEFEKFRKLCEDGLFRY